MANRDDVLKQAYALVQTIRAATTDVGAIDEVLTYRDNCFFESLLAIKEKQVLLHTLKNVTPPP